MLPYCTLLLRIVPSFGLQMLGPADHLLSEACKVQCHMSNVQVHTDEPHVHMERTVPHLQRSDSFTYCQKIRNPDECDRGYLWQPVTPNKKGGIIKPCHWQGDICDTYRNESDWVHPCPVNPAESCLHSSSSDRSQDLNVARSSEHGIIDHRNCPPGASSKQLSFIHIPKTGGESFEAAWGMRKNHHLATVRRDEFYKGRKRRDDMFVVSIVRDPFDRMWSWFKFCLRGNSHGFEYNDPEPECRLAVDLINKKFKSSAQGITGKTIAPIFAEWLRQQDSNTTGTYGVPAEAGGNYRFSSNMVDWLADPQTRQLIPDFVIRFEKYAEDHAELNRCLGTHTALPHENDSGDLDKVVKNKVSTKILQAVDAIDSSFAYVQDSAEIIKRWFAQDFDRVGYGWRKNLMTQTSGMSYALAFHGEYQRVQEGHQWDGPRGHGDEAIGSDFFVTYPNIKANIIDPLEFHGAKVTNYFDTFSFAPCSKHDSDLVKVLKPAKHHISKTLSGRIVDSMIRVLKMIQENQPTVDYIILLRFDAVYHKPILSLNIHLDNTNAAFRGNFWPWKQEHKMSDLFFVSPGKHLKALVQALDQSGDLDNITGGAGHFAYDPFVQIMGEGSVHFIDEDYQGSSTLDVYNPDILNVWNETFMHLDRSVGPGFYDC